MEQDNYQNLANTPALSRYRQLVVGDAGLLKWLQYEFISTFILPVGGLAGVALRKVFLRSFFKAMGKGCFFGHHISVRNPKAMKLGSNVSIDEYSMLSIRGEAGSIDIGDSVFIGRNSSLKTRNGRIQIGNESSIGPSVHIGTNSKITIGVHFLCGGYCYIGGIQHSYQQLDVPIIKQPVESRGGVMIEDDVWLGAQVVVLDGVKIGRGSIIGAGSVVTKDLAEMSISVGNPVRTIKYRNKTE